MNVNSILIIAMLIVVGNNAFCQKRFLSQQFEVKDLPTWESLMTSPKLYAINSYSVRKKSIVNIVSDIDDSVYKDAYISPCCYDLGDVKHGYFGTLILYQKEVPEDREFLVFKLDTPLQANENYNLRFDALYHMFTRYRVDSIFMLLLMSETDINKFFENNSYNGLQINVSMDNVNNCKWYKVAKEFVSNNCYNYMLLGNLKPDEDIKVIDKNNCRQLKRPNGNWNYSELFIDNVIIEQR